MGSNVMIYINLNWKPQWLKGFCLTYFDKWKNRKVLTWLQHRLEIPQQIKEFGVSFFDLALVTTSLLSKTLSAQPLYRSTFYTISMEYLSLENSRSQNLIEITCIVAQQTIIYYFLAIISINIAQIRHTCKIKQISWQFNNADKWKQHFFVNLLH